MQPRWRPSYGYCRESFSIELLPLGRAQYWLRFTVPEIQRLAPLLQLDQVEYRNRQIVDSTTALCIVCARLLYPGRWVQLADLFGRSPTWLSITFNDIITFLPTRFKDRLRWHRQVTQYSRLLEFSEVVEQLNGIQGI
jgi:hypothetical protein